MNDIEILEKYISEKDGAIIIWGIPDVAECEKMREAIENLINRIKELEEIEEEHRKENGKLKEELKEIKKNIVMNKNTK